MVFLSLFLILFYIILQIHIPTGSFTNHIQCMLNPSSNIFLSFLNVLTMFGFFISLKE